MELFRENTLQLISLLPISEIFMKNCERNNIGTVILRN